MWFVLVVLGKNSRAWVKSFKIGEILKVSFFSSFIPIAVKF